MTNKAKKIDVVKILSEGGATLDKNGAAVKFVKGFQVSKKDCYIIKAEKVNEIAGAIRDVLNRIGANEFCGVWVDSGRVYIDISERIKNKKKAVAVGVARKQISIFDWATGDCIECGRI